MLVNGVNKKYLNNTKKGFTLIELLAVIVILAVLALIATPIILNMINDAKKSAAVDSAYGYIEAIEYNNSMAQMDNTKYTLINDGTDIDINTIGNIEIKGTKPESGKVSITKGRITKATLCINSYNVEYDGKEAKVKGKCNEEETNLETNDSLLGYVAKKTLKNNTYETIKIKDETYTAHVYNYNGNQAWTSNMTFGDSNDVATNNENAKNMVIVKVNGDLTINGGVTVTAYASEEGYGGPKGLFIYVTGTLTNNGTITMTARGAKAEGQNVYLFKNSDGSYEYVPKEGANGGERTSNSIRWNPGNDGSNGINRQTGGVGSGACGNDKSSYANSGYGGAGASGTSYSGGTGGGAAKIYGSGSIEAESGNSNGGKGGDGKSWSSTYGASGGAGNPGGISAGNGTSGNNGTGGLLIIYSNVFDNLNTISSDGTLGGYNVTGGGSSGGGSINIFYSDNIKNIGLVSATGGESKKQSNVNNDLGGNGGNGTVTIGTFINNKFSNTVYNFDYTSNEQVFDVPVTGYYLLETWGAQGGSYNQTYRGGYGAYATGTISLVKNEKLYINVGGMGSSAIKENDGGYNGGGSRLHITSSDSYMGSGGGATHIATKSGLLSTLEEYIGIYNEKTGTYNSNEIFIISGGGGGSYWYNSSYYGIGGDAGGITGCSGYSYRNGSKYYSINSTQSSGYKFGEGNIGGTYLSGGGSGLYGGLSNNQNNSGGGSSFIGSSRLISIDNQKKAMYCYNCEASKEEATKTISTTNVSESPISNYAKIGNGYVRITYVAE